MKFEFTSSYVSVKSKLQQREFDYRGLPGGGEFDPHALVVGNLNCTLDFM